MIQNHINVIDLLKIDCEGHEFKIVPSLPPSVLIKIKEVKMEYQGGDVKIIIDHLKQNDFHITKHEKDDRFNAGMLWFSR